MKKIYIIPEIEVITALTTVMQAASDGGHSGSTGFGDDDPDANAAKRWGNGDGSLPKYNADFFDE